MDTKAYIESGVLELYVLDRLGPAERQEVEDYARQYPEIATELEAIERSLEDYALLRGQSTPPSADVLTRVMLDIRTTAKNEPQREVGPVEETRRGGTGIWLVVLLLAMAIAAAVYYYQQERQRAEELSALQARYAMLEQECNEVEVVRQTYAGQIASLTDPATQSILLAGTDNAPQSRAVIFYNPEEEETLFTAANLPRPPAGKQYQLWAIDAEGPQSLGVLSVELEDEAILTFDFVPDVAAFAITLEDEGGKPEPNLEALQVIGEV